MIHMEHCESVVQAVILSHLDYCNSLHLELPNKLWDRLQLTQNSTGRLILVIPLCHSVSGHLCDFHWLPVQKGSLFKALCICHKALADNHSSTNWSLITPFCPSWRLCSASTLGNVVVMPRVKKIWLGGDPFSIFLQSFGPISLQASDLNWIHFLFIKKLRLGYLTSPFNRNILYHSADCLIWISCCTL